MIPPSGSPTSWFSNPDEIVPFETIRRLLPYCAPFLLIDRAVLLGEEGIAVQKTVSGADPLVNAHLIHGPAVMPGVLMIEMVGQAGVLMAKLAESSPPRDSAPPPQLLGRCKARFHRPAFVGQTVIAYVLHGAAANGALLRSIVYCEEEIVAEIELVSGAAKQNGEAGARRG